MEYREFGFDDIQQRERERIRLHRQNRNVSSPHTIGLALSGGGIRSASFGLGVLQALNNPSHDKLKAIDYLSTVSGGGYIGSSFTWFNFLQAGKPWQFPFGTKGQGARSDDNSHNALDYIRQHGDYLKPGDGLGAASLVAAILRTLSMSFAVYFSLLTAIIWALVMGGYLSPYAATLDASLFDSSLLWVSVYAIGLFIISSLVYGLLTPVSRNLSRKVSRYIYWLRVWTQIIQGALLAIGVCALLLGLAPWMHWKLGEFLATLTAGGALTLGSIGGLQEFFRQKAGTAKTGSAFNSLKIWLVALLLIYGLLLGAYTLEEYLRQQAYATQYLLGLLAFGLIVGGLINLNYFGIGRMYRDRLAETFMPGRETIAKDKWHPAFDADLCKLSTVCGPKENGPYHLINTNIVLIDSDSAKFRGRGGDSFLLSPLFCGSDATGWVDTRDFLHNDMTLPTAMAISGAAANPHSGVSGRGPSRDRLVSFLMSFLGVRLGYWAKNPAADIVRRVMVRYGMPNYLYPGIVQGLFGHRLNAKAAYIELTDGGHFENLGLYELARRKVEVIIIADAAADPDFDMSDLANAIERIRVDFGYYVEFDQDSYALGKLLPGTGGDDVYARKYQLAQQGFAVARIRYDSNHSGRIIYLKTTLIAGLPEDLYGYKAAHADFPHQPTADQFFDEVQLDVYRELGYRLADNMLNENARQNWF